MSSSRIDRVKHEAHSVMGQFYQGTLLKRFIPVIAHTALLVFVAYLAVSALEAGMLCWGLLLILHALNSWWLCRQSVGRRLQASVLYTGFVILSLLLWGGAVSDQSVLSLILLSVASFLAGFVGYRLSFGARKNS